MEYISLGLTIVFAVFLGLGFLVGFKRGLKRTAVRGVWIITIVVAMLLLSTTLTNKLFDISLNVTVNGQVFPTLRAGITFLFEDSLPMSGADFTPLVDLVITMLSMMINILIFLVGYWALKIITLLPYWIGNIFIFAGERRRKRRARKEKQKYRVKKHRLLGALTGAVLGLVSFCITMTPVVGYLSIVRNIEDRTKSENGNGVIVDMLGDTYSQLLTTYDESVPMKVLSTLGIDNLLTTVFNGMTTTTVNDDRIVLADELNELADVYVIARDLSIPDFNTATQQEVSELLDTADSAIDAVFESRLISASADAIIPFAAKLARNMIDTSEFQPHVIQFYNTFFDQFEGFNALTTKQEVKGAINVIRVLNNRNLLLPIVQNNTGDTAEFLKLNLTKDAVDEVMNSIFALKTVDNLAPAMVNFLLGEGSVRYGYEYSTENEILAPTLKACATNILYSAIDILNVYDANLNTKVEINKTTIGAFGKILDELKIIISDDNFESIVNTIEPELESMALEAMAGSPQFLKDAVVGVIDNISEISGFNGAFTNLYNAYEIVKAEFDNAYIESESKYDVDLMDFEKLGTALNTFQNSELVGRLLFLDTMQNAVTYCVEELEKQITDDGSFEFSFDNVVINNLEILKGTGLDWSEELPVYKPTAGLIANLLQDSDNIANKLKSNADPTIESLGYELEHNLKTSHLFRGSDRLFVADILDIADITLNTSDDEGLSNSLSTLLMDAKENVLNEPDLNWETEFKHLKTLIQIEVEDTSDASILNIAKTIDSIVFDTVEDGETVLAASVIFKQDMINNFIVDYIDTIFGEVDEEDSLYPTIQQMKTAFENNEINSYTYEFDAMLKLKSIEEVISEDGFELKTGGINVGIKIDEALAVGVEDGVDPKVVITKSLINTLITGEIDNLMTGYNDLDKEITQIKNGFNDDIELYEVEMTAITNLITIADSVDESGFDFSDKTTAKTLGADIDTALSPVTVQEVDYHSTIITRDLINGYIKRVIDEDVDLGADSEFTDTITTITGNKKPDGTFEQGRLDTFRSTYESEFGYLAQLIEVSNNFADITIDNINDTNPVTNTSLAEEFDGSATVVDPLRNSYLVGDSLLIAIDDVIESFITDEGNQQYIKILTEVDNNYDTIRSQVRWASNAAGTKNYAGVIDALVELDESINGGTLTRTIQDVSHISSMAESYDIALATLQNNILLSTNGANEFAQYAMTKVIEKLSEQGVTFETVVDYANNYIEYLQAVKADNSVQPYNDATTTIVYKTTSGYVYVEPASGSYTTIQISSPFKYVGSLIDSINNI